MADIRIIPALGAINVTGSADFRGTGASSVLFVSGSGNVGIGTSTPSSKLHVAGAIKATALTGHILGDGTDTSRALSILDSNLAQASSQVITLGRANSNNNQAEISFYLDQTGSAANRLSLGLYNSGDTLNVLGSGKVGVGTTAPKQILDVAGAGGKIAITNTGTSNYSEVVFYEGSTVKADIWVNGSTQTDYAGASSMNIWQGSNAPMAFYTNGTNERMRITADGNIGIGTTNPNQKLVVAGNIAVSASNSTGAVWFGTGQNIGLYRDNTYDLVLAQQEASGNPLYLAGAGDVIVSIDSNNNETSRKFIVGNNAVKATNELFSVNESGNVYISNDLTVDGIITAKEFHTTFVSASIIYQSGSTQFGNSTDDTHEFTGNVTVNTPANNSIGNGVRIDRPGNYYAGFEFAHTGSVDWSFGVNSAGFGIYENGAAATTRLSIKDGGDVGIGTTNPAVKLQVHLGGIRATGTTSTTGQVDASPNFGAFRFYDGSTFLGGLGTGQWASVGGSGDSIMYLAANRAFHISNTASPRFTVASDGKVGIGTTAPYAPVHLKVEGTPPSSGQQGYYGNLVLEGDADKWNRLRFDTAGTGSWGVAVNTNRQFAISRLDSSFSGTPDDDNFVIDTTGNVGIGTTSPTATLQIRNGQADLRVESTTGGQSARLMIKTTTREWRLGTFQSQGDNFWVYDQTALAYRMAIDTSGNVGIGTTSPGAKLHVSGSARINGTIYSGDGSISVNNSLQLSYSAVSGTGTIAAKSTGGNTTLALQTANSGTTADRLYISNTGAIKFNNYGSGTNTGTAAYRLSVDSSGNIIEESLGAGAVDGSGTTNYVTKWSDSDTLTTSVMYDDGTNVGVGESSPSYKLHVGGTFRASSLGTFGGSVGIGLTNPTAKLDIYKSGSLVFNVVGSQGQLFSVVDSLSGSLMSVNDISGVPILEVFSDDRIVAGEFGTNALVVTGSRVGVGTSSPESQLTVDNGHLTIKNGGVLYVENPAGGRYGYLTTNASGTALSSYDGANEPLLLQAPQSGAFINLKVGTTDIMRLIGGKVGIGTTNPATKLHVISDQSSAGTLRLQNTSNTGYSNIQFYSASGAFMTSFGYINKGVSTIGGTTLLDLDSGDPLVIRGGSVGIGLTNPSHQLDVTAAAQHVVRFTSTTADNGGLIINKSNASYNPNILLQAGGSTKWYILSDSNDSDKFKLYEATGTSPRFTLTQGGNVGIGSTAPESELAIQANSGTGIKGIFVNSGNLAGQTNPILLWLEATGEVGMRYKEIGGAEYFQNTYDGTKMNWKYFNGSIYATRMSLTNAGNLNLVGDMTVDGILTAREFHTTFVSASIIYQSGSTQFGNSADDTHTFTGDIIQNGNYSIKNGTEGNVFLKHTTSEANFWTYQESSAGWGQFVINDNTELTNLGGIHAGSGLSTVLTTTATVGINISGVTGAGSGVYSSIGFNHSTGNAYFAGNVGIGATAPSAKLHTGPGNWASSIANKNYSGAAINTSGSDIATGRVLFQGYNEGGSQVIGINNETNRLVLYNYTGSRYLQIWDHAGSSYIAPDAGNVGIGTSSSSRKLTVYSTENGNYSTYIYHGGATSNSYGLLINAGTDATDAALRVRSKTGDDYFEVQGNGNVGIGTATPSYKLDVNGGSTIGVARFYNSSATSTILYYGDTGNTQYTETQYLANDGVASIFKSGTGYASYGGPRAFNIYNEKGGISLLPNNATSPVLFATGSNIGIGTTSPTAYLQVGTPGSTLTRDLLLVKGGGGSGNYGFRVQANNADELFLVNTYTYNTTIPYAGEVYGRLGVGTTAPQAKLHVAGTALFEKGITIETDPAIHSGSNWYSITDAYNIVRVTDSTELYIEKEAGAAGYGYYVVNPEEVGLNFDISFRLSGGVPTSYRHLGIAIANDGSNTVANFDYIVFRNNPSLPSSNQIRIDVAGSTEQSLVGTSVPDFFDGTERHVLIQVRNNQYVVEVDGVVEHTFTASARTNSRGLVGFSIYEAAAADTWVKIRDFAITQHSDNRTILAGNVGIGLRNPGELLHIYGGASGYGTNVRIDSTNEYGGLGIFEAGNLRGTVAYGNAGNILTGAGSNSLSIRSENALHLAGSGDSLTATVVSGKVGIGTTDPLTKLHVSSVSVNPASAAIQGDSKIVVSGVDGNIDLFSQDDNSTVSNAIGMGRYNATTGALIHKFGLVTWAATGNQGSNAGDRIAFHYGTGADTWGSTELMSIAATGNVGIGSTAPSYKLDVSAAARIHGVRMGRDFSINNRATVRLDSNGDNPADVLFGQTAAANETSWTGVYWGISSRNSGTAAYEGNKFTIFRGSAHASPNNSENQFLTITPDLKMGIANTAPNYPLDVTGKIYSTTEVQGGTAFIKDTSGISVFGSNTSTRSIRVGRDGTANDIFITGSNGDVGIGISTPAYKLHVNGDLRSTGITSTDSISVIHSAGYGFYSGPSSFQSFGSGVSTILLQGTQANGRAGALWFKGYQGDDVASLYVTDDTQDNYGTTLAAYSGSIRFATQTLAGAKMTITSAGDVGIGTGSPIGKLQIGGTSGNLLTVGTLTNNWAGEVAIGVTNGNGVIISKVNTANDTNRVLVFYRDDTNGASIFGYTPSGGSTDIGFQIRSNNTSYFNGGGVGIGTSSPAARLHVSGSILAGDISGAQTQNNITIYHGGGNLADGTIRSYFELTNPSAPYVNVPDAWNWKIATVARPGTSGNYNSQLEILRSTRSGVTDEPSIVFKRDGNVGIGETNPTNKLVVKQNSSAVAIGEYNTGAIIWMDGSNGDFTGGDYFGIYTPNETRTSIGYAGAEAFTVTSGSNVGVGTTAPTAALHVYRNQNQPFIVQSPNANTWMDLVSTQGTWSMGAANGNKWMIYERGSNGVRMTVSSGGALQLNNYGGASQTGTVAYHLAVDSGGNVIESNSFTGSLQGNITGTAGSETLATVTGRGNTTTNDITVGKATVSDIKVESGGGNSIRIGDGFGSGGTATIHNYLNDLYLQYGNGNPTTYVRFGGGSTAVTLYDSQNGNYQIGSNTTASFFGVNSGNVGIGTNNPGYKLQINGTTAGFSAIGASDNIRTGLAHYDTTAQAAGVGGQLVLGYKYTDAGDYTEGAIIKMYKENGTTGQYGSGLKFQVRNNGENLATEVVIDPTGNLGVGQTSPSAKLHVLDGVNVTAFKLKGTTTATYATFGDSSTTSYSGITYETNAGNGQIWHAGNSYSTSWGGPTSLNIYNSIGHIAFHPANSANAMTIASTTNVGIGSTAPGYKLDVNGGIRLNGKSALTDNAYFIGAPSYGFRWNNNADTFNNVIMYDNGNMYVRGSVGIGVTSPQTKLQVNGPVNSFAAHFGQGQNNGDGDWSGIGIGYAETANSLYRKVGIVAEAHADGAARQHLHFLVDTVSDANSATLSDSKMMIDGFSGNVGVNTTTPAAKLDVYQSGSLVFNVAGSQGQLFSVTDSLSGSLMSVNDISGVPILEVFSDDKVVAGEFGTNALVVTGSRVGVGTDAPGSSLEAVIPAGGQQVFRVRNHATAAGSFTNNYAAEIRSAYTTGATAGALLVHTQEANDARPTMAVSDSNGVFTTFVNGKVGIGSNSPGYKLTVDNDALNTNNPALYVKNPNSSTAAVIAEFVGDSDSVQIKNVGVGDYVIYNTQQNNGIALYDGVGGVEIHYAGSTVLEADSNGGIKVTGQLSATADVIAYSSDERLKENIKPIENAVDKVKQLNGVTFDWNDKSEELGFEPSTKLNDVGVIAQEVEKIFPQLVHLAPFDIGSDEEGNTVSKSGEDYKTVNYSRLTPVLIEAIKEQQVTVETQQKEIDQLKSELKAIRDMLLNQKP